MADELAQGATAEPAAMAPSEELSAFVGVCAAIFYWAESPHNPAVRTYWDAFHYIATSLSVGYANIFPTTQLGKLVGGVVMVVGPALSARALDSSRTPEAAASDPALLAKLDQILVELKRIGPEPDPIYRR